MAYFIFLKYMRSLEEFRKNHCVQIPPKSPCANFHILGIFKNSIFNQKRNFLQLLAQSGQWPAGPTGLSAHMAQQAVFFLLPHRSKARKPPPPAGRPCVAPMIGPGYLHRRENNGRITPPSFSPLCGGLPPLQSPVTGAFNPEALKLLQRKPLKAPGLPHLASTL
jgi:hypothetical protein